MTINTIIGIDPASSSKKKTIAVKVCLDPSCEVKDVKLLELSHQELIEEKQTWKQGTLVLWDAPLTGVPLGWKIESEGYFTRRPLEQRLEKLTRNAKGISVLGYGSGCPHLPLTQHLFGLPKMGPYHHELDQLPLLLVFQQDQLLGSENDEEKRARIVEVHPAFAMWAWLKKDHSPSDNDWTYKKPKQENRRKWLEALIKLWKAKAVPKIWDCRDVVSKANKSDDVFDALIAAMLGLLAIKPCKDLPVKLYGDKDAGAMLLPRCEAFDDMKLTPEPYGTKRA